MREASRVAPHSPHNEENLLSHLQYKLPYLTSYFKYSIQFWGKNWAIKRKESRIKERQTEKCSVP
jgi:hypothetical protein